MRDLPPKLYYRIGEVAELVGVEPHVLRYWEREFRSIRPTKSAKGQRVYSRRDVENLLRVRELLYSEGFTIAGAKKKMQCTGSEPREGEGEREAARGCGGDQRAQIVRDQERQVAADRQHGGCAAAERRFGGLAQRLVETVRRLFEQYLKPHELRGHEQRL